MYEHRLARNADGKHYLVRLIPYREVGESIGGVVVTLVDVTTLAHAEEHQNILISELNHRVKNMLAVVVSIANHTLERARTPEEFNSAVIGRLRAMSRTYGLLSRTNWKEASVADIVQQEMEVFGTERFQSDGPDLNLSPQHGLSIGMVIHELATNAAKHGALGSPDGVVSIHWTLEEGRFQLVWKETGGPPVESPLKEGFGLSLVRGEVEYRFGGTVGTFFHPEGLAVCVMLPLNP
jgi:two-component system CheB/CheR fusion protein